MLVSHRVPISAGINKRVPALLGCCMGQQCLDSLALHGASGCPLVEHQQLSSAKKGAGDFFLFLLFLSSLSSSIQLLALIGSLHALLLLCEFSAALVSQSGLQRTPMGARCPAGSSSLQSLLPPRQFLLCFSRSASQDIKIHFPLPSLSLPGRERPLLGTGFGKNLSPGITGTGGTSPDPGHVLSSVLSCPAFPGKRCQALRSPRPCKWHLVSLPSIVKYCKLLIRQ